MNEKVELKEAMYFLNRNYYINLHLVERLDELYELPLFEIVNGAMIDAISMLGSQLEQTKELSAYIGVDIAVDKCEPMICFLESIFPLIFDREYKNPYLSLLDYVSVADGLMEESSRLAKLTLYQFSVLNLPKFVIYQIKTLQSLKDLLADTLVLV